ncbi:hypothetical protein V2J95_15350 [Pseudomonas alliivorans]|nr:hypothetical protein [Pseudomonas alliivorans]
MIPYLDGMPEILRQKNKTAKLELPPLTTMSARKQFEWRTRCKGIGVQLDALAVGQKFKLILFGTFETCSYKIDNFIPWAAPGYGVHVDRARVC